MFPRLLNHFKAVLTFPSFWVVMIVCNLLAMFFHLLTFSFRDVVSDIVVIVGLCIAYVSSKALKKG